MDIAAYAAKAAAAAPMPESTVPSPVEGLVVHVDGDYCAYFCSGNDDTDAGTARRILLNKLEQLQRVSGATSCIVHMTDPASRKGERYLAATLKPYQGQRKAGRKPRNWAMLREFMSDYDGHKFRTKNWLEREADDGIAYVAHHAALHNSRAVIATADKDMRMLPGTHVVWATRQLVEVPFNAYEVAGPDGKTYGHKFFWLQCLMGDSADHIPGLPKYKNAGGKLVPIAEKTAELMLGGTESNTDAFLIVRELYRSYYEDAWADALAEQMSLLWLRTDRHASIKNFLNVCPQDGEMNAAAVRLESRVTSKRAELEQLLCGG